MPRPPGQGRGAQVHPERAPRGRPRELGLLAEEARRVGLAGGERGGVGACAPARRASPRGGAGSHTPLPPRRPLLAGRAGAGPALLQPPATQHVQAGQRQGARVFARRVALLALRAARLGRLPRPGPVPVSAGARIGPSQESETPACRGPLGLWLLLARTRGAPGIGRGANATKVCGWAPNLRSGGRPPPSSTVSRFSIGELVTQAIKPRDACEVRSSGPCKRWGTWGGGAPRGRARPQLRPGTHRCHLPSRLNGSSLENDAFSDKSERELAQESDDETQDHSRKTNESGSDRSEAPGGPTPRGTTYVEQVHEELGEVRTPQPGDRVSPCAWPHP